MYNLEPRITVKTMKNILLFFFAIALTGGLLPTHSAAAQDTGPTEAPEGGVLCPTGVYLSDPGDCLPLGPSQIITERARQGFPYPPQTLAALNRDDGLAEVPFLYYKITEYKTNTYSSLEAAISKSGPLRQIGPGALIYLTYLDVAETDRGTYFLLPSGEWMPGDGTRVSTPNLFRGLEFVSTPRTAFGWAIFGTDVYASPGYTYGIQVVGTLPKHEIVQVYNAINIEGEDWVLIGPDMWIPGRQVGVVYPNTTPPAGVTTGRWVDIDLAEQTLAVYDNYQLVFASLVATGMEPYWTRPGLFPIYSMKETEDMSGAFEADRSDYYYLEKVPYTLYFDKARAIHGAYWRTSLGFEQSHGCVNMSIGDAAWVYRWVKEGDWVYVHDRTGKTPADPEIYGDGGA
jgi:lipoprotein-anchoring transpeptidase ErfK/SrfK